MLLEVTVIAEENLTKSKIFSVFSFLFIFVKSKNGLKKKISQNPSMFFSQSLSLIRQYKSMKVRYSQQCSSLEYEHIESAL